MPDFDFDKLLKNLELQTEKYKQILQLSKQQDEILSSPDIEPVMEVIKKKNKLLQDVDQINKEIAPIKKNWDKVTSQFTEEQKKQIESALTLIGDYLKEILQFEDKHMNILSLKKEEFSSQIQDLLKRRKAIKTYAQPSKKDKKQIDKKE
jgi:DNA integrity scanning protein DisA with diadenylate cyclase activity